MKRILSAALMFALLLTVVPASAWEATVQALPLGTIAGEGVVLYGSPSATAPQLGAVDSGEEVLVLQAFTDWIQVYSFSGQLAGWVGAPQVNIMTSDTASGFVEFYPAIVISKSISLRTDANIRSARIASLPNATLLDVLNDQGTWLYVNVWDEKAQAFIQGWVISDYVVRNPRFVTTHQQTYVYAVPEWSSKKVGELVSGAQLVVIGEYNGYWVVNLREASGFIRKSDLQYIE